jgi:predicted dehydrogenase
MLALAEEADKKNLKVGVGLMCRHCKARGELFDRIQNGEIGDVIMLRAYRMHPPVGSAFTRPKPASENELMWQIKNFHSFLWASGGCYSDFYIHNIDECCWMKNAWPVKAQALGGRHYRGDHIDQNFDTYAVEYTFDDGAKLWLDGRVMTGCHQEFASYAHGSKGSAHISGPGGHAPAKSRIFRNQNIQRRGGDVVWAYPDAEPSPYELEWIDLVDAVRQNKPYNEAVRGTQASLVTSMGRMAAHTGQVVTYDQMLNSDHEFAPDVDKLVLDGTAPLVANAEGKYPIPQPGITTDREYA